MTTCEILEAPTLHPGNGRVPMRTTPFTGRGAWRAATLSPDDGLVKLDAACEAEIDRMVEVIRANPMPVLMLSPDLFEVSACRAAMGRAKEILDRDVGFAIVDRVPIERYSQDECRAVGWVLCQLLGRPVSQSHDGKVLYDVRDTGKAHGYGVRASLTNIGQHFHTDNSSNLCAPEYVALFCLQKAKEGGVNSVVSFETIHNELLRRHPDLLPRFYDEFLIDRQKEHPDGAPPVLGIRLFQYDGEQLVCRTSRNLILAGYKLAGREIDDAGRRALEALTEILAEPGIGKDFNFEPGQIQIVDNQRCGHRRTAFTDHPEPERRRHLIRVWIRNSGRPFFNG